MAGSSLFLRSSASASLHGALLSASFLRHPSFLLRVRTEGLGFRRSRIFFAPFSAQALAVSEHDAESCSLRKNKSPASSWEEAGEAFFQRKGKNGTDSGNGKGHRQERSRFSDSVTTIGKSNRYAANQPALESTAERKNALNEGSRSSRKPPTEFNKGREAFNGKNFGYVRREFKDGYGGRGTARTRGLKEEFSATVDDSKAFLRDSRSGFEGRSRSNARSDFDSRGFRNDHLGDRSFTRADGAFRREFGDSVDTSKSYFRKGRHGGNFGKKQFPDVDGGKRMFNGRFEGDGFFKDPRSDNGLDGGNRGKKSYGTGRRGQVFSKGSPGGRGQRLSEDDLEPKASSEEDEEEKEDFPQAGDVIRHREIGNVSTEISRRQLPMANGEGQFQDDNEAEMESDECEEDDDITYKGRDLGSFRKERPAMYSSLPKLVGEMVYGIGPVHAALHICRREFYCLYVQQDMPLGGGNAGNKKNKKAVEWIIRTAMDKGLEVKEVTKHDLNMLSENRPHQGLILDSSPLEFVVSTHLEVPFAANGKTPVWVALDEVTDPQNFGAILRSAYFLGAEGVVVCAKNSAPLNAVVSKASAGALEVMELRSCKNMMKFLDWSAENGWRVVGGSAADKGVTSVRELPRGLPTILVLGGEGKGLRTNVKRACSKLVCIPGLASQGVGTRVSLCEEVQEVVMNAEDNDHQKAAQVAHRDFAAVDSLNVSVAAGILLHELLNNEASTAIPNNGHHDLCEGGVEDKTHAQHSENVIKERYMNEQEQHPYSESDKEEPLYGGEDQDTEIIVGEMSSKEQILHCPSDCNEEGRYAEIVATAD